MRPFMVRTYKFCWMVSTCLLIQCSMPTGGDRTRVSSDTKAAGGENAQAKTNVESLEPSNEGDKTQDPSVAEKDRNASIESSAQQNTSMPPPPETPAAMPEPTTPDPPTAPAPIPAPTPAPPSQNPMTPNGTYLVNLTCNDTMAFSVSLGSNTVSRSITAPKSCTQLMTALNGKTFPTGAASVEALVGGPTTKASCTNGTLNFSTVGTQSGASFETALVYNLNNNQVCQEIRDLINGLKL